MIAQAPSRATVQARLTAAESDIFGLGVRRLALFGSVRRDTARPDSDVDFLVGLHPQLTRAALDEDPTQLRRILGAI